MKDAHTGLERDKVLESLESNGWVKAHAARALGIPRSTFRGVLDRLGIDVDRDAGKVFRVEVTEREVDPSQYASMRRQLIAAQETAKQLRVENRELAAGANVLEGARDLLAPLVEGYVLDAPDHVPPPLDSDSTPVVGVLHLCDWHLGEIVRPETIGGMNEYSPDIAVRRMTHVIDVVSRLVAMYQDERGMSEIVVVANGDLANGAHNLHPDSADEAARIVVQAFDAGLLLAQVVRDLAAIVPKVRVVSTGSDNHTRSTKRPPTGRAAIETSWGQVVTEYAAVLAREIPNAEWRLGRSYRVELDVAGSTMSAMHGHMMKGGGGAFGIPLYSLKRTHEGGVTRGVAKSRRTGELDIAKHTRIAHFHTFSTWQMGDGTVTICPSLKGSDAFSIDALERFSPAGQLFEVFHPSHDLIAQHCIDAQYDVPDESRYTLGALRDESPTFHLLDA